MKSFKFGQSALGLPIIGHRFGNSGPSVLILGGVHGDEWEGVMAANALLNQFMESFTYKLQVTLVPSFNMDGVLFRTRKNSNQVDLNRNLPTNDWTNTIDNERYQPGPHANSESENQALVEWLKDNQPKMIISLHSWKPLLNTNGRCKEEAEIINKLTGYEVMDSIGYPTPGCLGTYCGLERDMPTLTYEIERDIEKEKIFSVHVPALLESLKVTEEKHK